MNEDETAEHVLFCCPRFFDERRQLNSKCGRIVDRSNLVPLMLQRVEVHRDVADPDEAATTVEI